MRVTSRMLARISPVPFEQKALVSGSNVSKPANDVSPQGSWAVVPSLDVSSTLPLKLMVMSFRVSSWFKVRAPPGCSRLR